MESRSRGVLGPRVRGDDDRCWCGGERHIIVVPVRAGFQSTLHGVVFDIFVLALPGPWLGGRDDGERAYCFLRRGSAAAASSAASPSSRQPKISIASTG